MEMKKKVVIITCFEANEPRVDYIKRYFEKSGNSVKVISTDFIHRGKKVRSNPPEGYTYIKTRPYKRNLSITRLFSHYCFAKDALQLAMSFFPDLLYVLIPANSLAKFSGVVKLKTDCKLIFDIVDLWPESLPCRKMKNHWPFTYWKNLRDNHLKYADVIITECSLYQNILNLKKFLAPSFTVYWPQEDYGEFEHRKMKDGILRFLYLGSINNIIDVDGILLFLKTIQKIKSIELQIVGDGERRKYFIELLQRNYIPYKFYGFVYEHKQLQQIASECDMGINLMKPTVEVGLTMKSVSYFGLGLPIINNIKGDTWDLVNQFKIGINLSPKYEFKPDVYSDANLKMMGENAREAFIQFFSEKAFEEQLNMALSELTF